LYRDVGNGIAGAGVEYYLPLFFDQTATLAEYLPPDSGWFCTARWSLLHADSGTRRTSVTPSFRTTPCARACPPGHLFLTAEELFSQFKSLARLTLTEARSPGLRGAACAGGRAQERRSAGATAHVEREISRPRLAGGPILPAGAKTIAQMLSDSNLTFVECEQLQAFTASSAPLLLGTAPLASGICLVQRGLAVVTEAELYAASPRRQRRTQRDRTSNIDSLVRDLAELRLGDPVVHVEHGIGRYLGLETLDLGAGPTEFLHLLYATTPSSMFRSPSCT